MRFMTREEAAAKSKRDGMSCVATVQDEDGNIVLAGNDARDFWASCMALDSERARSLFESRSVGRPAGRLSLVEEL